MLPFKLQEYASKLARREMSTFQMAFIVQWSPMTNETLGDGSHKDSKLETKPELTKLPEVQILLRLQCSAEQPISSEIASNASLNCVKPNEHFVNKCFQPLAETF